MPGEKVYDTATVSGTPFTPTGTVTYYFYNTASPVYGTTTPVSTQTVTLSSGLVPNSATTAALTAGSDAFIGVYSGDSNYKSSVGAVEPVTINKASPKIVTTPSTTSGMCSTTLVLKDTAVLSGGYNETGTITFTLYYNGGSTAVDTETVSVNGNGSYTTPTGVTASKVGTYQWDATYSGDTNNQAVSDINNPNEKVTIGSASPSIVTTPSVTALTLGTTSPTLKDTAVLSGAVNPTGTITFTLYLGSTKVDTETATVSGNGSYTTPTGYTLPKTGTVTGTYQWDASYSGDSNNSSVSENNNANEQVVVSPATPTIVTTPSTNSGQCSTTLVIKDTAVLSGGNYETGTITFTLYYNGGNTPIDTETLTVNGNGSYTTPTGVTASKVGTYQWDAAYSGDSDNKAVSDINNPNEKVTIGSASPSIVTTPSVTALTLGTTSPTLKDTAVLSGAVSPTGTITFTLYLGSTKVDTETATVSGNGSYTTPTGYTLPKTGTVTGTYQWDASYSGDSNNSSVSENNNANEQVVVSPATPTIVTTPSTNSGQCSTTLVIKDTAVLSGGNYETGTITFTLYYNGGSSAVDTETVSVNGNGSYSTPNGYTASKAGTYQWDAAYSGDSDNKAVSDINNPNEKVTIGSASPSISTTPNTTVVPVGTCTTLTDSATLSGGVNPTGSITFTLYSPSGSKLDTATVTVNGDGTYTTPGYSLSASAAAGIYQWDATYNGDSNNSKATDNNDPSEQVWVVTPCCNLQNVSFTVDNSSGHKVGTYSSLGGNTQQGDTVTVNFTVPSGNYDQLSLVSYVTPQSYFSATSAYLQTVFQSSTGLFGPGSGSLTVTLPSSYYQVDFVCGTAITQLGLSTGDFYSAQGRLQSSDNGGTTIPSSMAGSTVCAGQTAAPSFWINTAAGKGQALITSLNGGSSATNLGNWLATISPNLLGSLAGKTNAQVASYVKGLGSTSSLSEVVATALAAYVTDSSLAGTAATSYGFTVTTYGTGVDNYNVGSNGSALGLSNNTVYSIVTLLAAIDSESSNGSINSSASSAANTVFTAINKAGGIS